MADVIEALMRLLASGHRQGEKLPYAVVVHIDHVDKIVNMPLYSERRFVMSELDLSQASDAAAYIVQVVVPYAVGKMADGALNTMGKDTYEAVRDKATTLWKWVKEAFKGDSRLEATVSRVEETTDAPKFAENVDYLHSDLATWLQHNPQSLAELAKELEGLRQLLPNLSVANSGDQSIGNVTGGAKVTQIGPNSSGNTVIN